MPADAGRPGRSAAGDAVAFAARRPGAAVACAHCGLAVPAGLVREGDAEQFCCAGCRQVYTLVREWGFDRYYRLVERQQGALEPARVTGRSFEDFDDARVQAEATASLGPDRRRTRLYLEGVHCAACVWLVEKLPAVLAGVDEVRLNYGSAVAEVTWRPGHTRLSTIARALDRLGYTPHLHRAAGVQEARRVEDRAALARLGVAAACAMNLMFLHGALYAGEYSGMASPYETFFRWLSFAVAVRSCSSRRVRSSRRRSPGSGPASSTSICPSRSPWPSRSRPARGTPSAAAGRSGSTRSPCSSRRCSAPGRCSAAPSGRRSSAPTACAARRSSSSRASSPGPAPTRPWSRSR